MQLDYNKLVKLIQDAEAATPGVTLVVEDVLSIFAAPLAAHAPGAGKSHCPPETRHVLSTLGVQHQDIDAAEKAGFDWSSLIGVLGPLLVKIINRRKGGGTATAS